MADPGPPSGRARPPTSRPSARSVEAVVPPTYGPIDAAYAQRMLDEWWTPEVFATSLERNAHLVAEVDGEVVALANLGRLSQSYRDFPHVTGDREVMWKLYVHPDHQGRGIGSRLLAEIEALVEGDELWLEVVDGNEQAYDFYRARGFEEVERVTDGDRGPTTSGCARSSGTVPAMSRFQQVRRRRPARAARRPRRGARRHRPGRDGRLLARARDARVPAAREQRPGRARRARPAGRRAPARDPPAQQPRRHHAGGPRAARQGGARRARPAGPRHHAWTTATATSARWCSTTCRPPPRPRSASCRRTTGSPRRRARPTRRSRTCSAASCSTSASPA